MKRERRSISVLFFFLQGVVGFVDVADELKRGADGGIGRLAQGVNRCRASGTLGGNRRP